MMLKKLVSLSFLSVILLAFCADDVSFANNYANTNSINNDNSLSGYVSYVPAGTTIEAVLAQEINSQNAIVGQSITAILKNDFLYNSKLVAPSGSVIGGTITFNRKAGLAGKFAKTQIRFTTITTPYGNVIPISGVILTDDTTGILKASTAKDNAKEYAKNAAVGAGAGAVSGVIAGALSGSVGRGAIYGTALGAGLGIISNVANKGDSIIIPVNSIINVYFTQPITLSAQ